MININLIQKIAGARRSIFCMMCLLLASLLSGCSSDNQDLLDTFEQVKARKGRPIEKTPDFKFVPKFVYPSHLKRRDPFFKYKNISDRISKKKKTNVNAPNFKRQKQALEQFKLKDLRMVGLLKKDGSVWGLISTPDEQVLKVTMGNYLGKNYGKVRSISGNKIRITEKYKKNNEWKKRSVIMSLDTVDKKTVSHKTIKFEEFVH